MDEVRAGCTLCDPSRSNVVWRDSDWRIEVADHSSFPYYLLIVFESHVPELTDISAADRYRAMDLIASVESVLRVLLSPRKINVASLGNQVAHLHWHVIARFEWDLTFPDSIWSPARSRPCPSAPIGLPPPEEVHRAIYRELSSGRSDPTIGGV